MVKKFLLWRRFVKWLRGIACSLTGGKKINWGEKVKEGLDIAKDAVGQKKQHDEQQELPKSRRRIFGRWRTREKSES